MRERGGRLPRALLSTAHLEQPLDSSLSLGEIADSHAGAVAFLAQSGGLLRTLNRASVFCRVLLGRQLLVIQEQHLWSQMERPVPDERGRIVGPFHSWDDFLSHGFPQISGLGKKTGYAALMLAKSPTLQKLPESELRKLETLSNAFELVKLERKGVAMNEELIAAAQTLPAEEFRQMIGAGKKATVAVVVDSRDTARLLQPIIDILKRADPDALQGIYEVFEHAMIQGGGNATDAVDCINAACLHQWQQEGILQLP